MDICTVLGITRCFVPLDLILIGLPSALAGGILLTLIFAPKRVVAEGYLEEAKWNAYMLLETADPDPKAVEQTKSDLRRFPEDQEARDYLRRLSRKKARTVPAQSGPEEATGVYYHPLSLPPIYYGR